MVIRMLLKKDVACAADGCSERAARNMLCLAHCSKQTMERRFWAKVQKTDSCWLWTGARHVFRGKPRYGRFRVNGKLTFTHRLSWTMHFGDIPDGLQVNHRCDVTNCIRPDHLELGTQADNMRHRTERNRVPRGESTGRAKLTEREVAAIRALCDRGAAKGLIAEAVGINPHTLTSIVKRRSWTHVP